MTIPFPTPPTTPIHAQGLPAAAPSPTLRPLSSLRPGQTAILADGGIGEAGRLDPDDAALLRAMGLSDQVRIRLCRAGEPCIIALGSVEGGGADAEGRHCHCHGHCRIGLARGLADRILVTVLA